MGEGILKRVLFDLGQLSDTLCKLVSGMWVVVGEMTTEQRGKSIPRLTGLLDGSNHAFEREFRGEEQLDEPPGSIIPELMGRG